MFPLENDKGKPLFNLVWTNTIIDRSSKEKQQECEMDRPSKGRTGIPVPNGKRLQTNHARSLPTESTGSSNSISVIPKNFLFYDLKLKLKLLTGSLSSYFTFMICGNKDHCFDFENCFIISL
ncbi:hypothetical protein KUTeg_014370 [Tegillarca granosa]|uniref:Uncharacterized protein n=1 Tax=Tegillarca granosa TaxID=220873 RepID=A0ABQ9EYW4_TEGGR|nr:hypothetical protein KUTeg_014370 [Tegillarca granosa]